MEKIIYPLLLLKLGKCFSNKCSLSYNETELLCCKFFFKLYVEEKEIEKQNRFNHPRGNRHPVATACHFTEVTQLGTLSIQPWPARAPSWTVSKCTSEILPLQLHILKTNQANKSTPIMVAAPWTCSRALLGNKNSLQGKDALGFSHAYERPDATSSILST